MNYKYFVLLVLLLTSSCATRQPKTQEISKAGALREFDDQDYDQAIAQFSALRRQNPDDPVLTNYLAQSYLGRSGMSLGDITVSLMSLEKTDSDVQNIISKFFESLPPVSPLARSDIAETVRITQSFNASHANEDMRRNELLYHILYAAYLVKIIHTNALEDARVQNFENIHLLLNTILKKSYTEITEIVFQIKAVLSLIDSISGKLKDRVKKLTEKKELTLKYKGKSHTLSFKDGYENGLNQFLEDILQDDYTFFLNMMKELNSRVDSLSKTSKSIPPELMQEIEKKIETFEGDERKTLEDKFHELQTKLKNH